jgi:hypothetical protein
MTRESSDERATAHIQMGFDSMVAFAKGGYCVDKVADGPPNCERTVPLA